MSTAKYSRLHECRFPVPYTPLTEVHLIHIREGPALKGTGLEQRDEFGLKEIENIVRARLAFLIMFLDNMRANHQCPQLLKTS